MIAPVETMPSGALLDVAHVTKRFPPIRKGLGGIRTLWEQLKGQAQTVTALEDVSFQVRRGEIFGLLGPNGAGKTTLCKILNALVIPTSGRVTVRGLETVKYHHALAPDMVTVFGGESDLFGFFAGRLSTQQNLEFVGDLWGLERQVTRARITEVFKLLDFEDKREEWYQKLSGGTKQKLFLAVPLILRRAFTVLDEPTIRLDVPTKRKVQELIQSVLNQECGSTILLTTHDMAEAERLCDRIAILNKGRLALVDTPAGLRQRTTRGPVLTLRVRLGLDRGQDEGRVRAAVLAAAPGSEVGLDAAADQQRGDGLTSFVVRTRHVAGTPADDGITPQILAGLTERGVRLLGLTDAEPSLEDAFVEILGEDVKEAGK